MTNITKHAEGLIKRNRELSRAMQEFGQSFTWLGQSEGDAVGAALVEVRKRVGEWVGEGG